jgi:hypothetical protein
MRQWLQGSSSLSHSHLCPSPSLSLPASSSAGHRGSVVEESGAAPSVKGRRPRGRAAAVGEGDLGAPSHCPSGEGISGAPQSVVKGTSTCRRPSGERITGRRRPSLEGELGAPAAVCGAAVGAAQDGTRQRPTTQMLISEALSSSVCQHVKTAH